MLIQTEFLQHFKMNDPDIYSFNHVHSYSSQTMTSSSLDPHAVVEGPSSEDDATPVESVQGGNGSRTSSHGSSSGPQSEHVIGLSSIEHCMPRAYIRICLAYRVADEEKRQKAIQGLKAFVKRIVEAKPYLAGVVTDVKPSGKETGRAEIRFTTLGCRKYPEVEVKTLLNKDGTSIRYDDLNEAKLPPSRLPPEDVSALPPNVDPQERAVVFRVQANLVEGGLIVSIYLHHCISDGTGFDLMTSGEILNDGFTFPWPASLDDATLASLNNKLKEFAYQKTQIRQRLSIAPSDTPNTRGLKANRLDEPARPPNKLGRGCVILLSSLKIEELVRDFNTNDLSTTHTTNSVIMALIWRHMTRARQPSVSHDRGIRTSKLLIPVNIRERLDQPLPAGYFGAAVDFGKAELDLDELTISARKSLMEISQLVRRAVREVNDAYVRQAIAFANNADALTDVHDIQASNMDRINAADMYITSWLKLRTYQHDLGMELGGPDWVRKPWSRDPGSCIILPKKGSKPAYYEAVVQMTVVDMDRLLKDQEFREFVIEVID